MPHPYKVRTSYGGICLSNTTINLVSTLTEHRPTQSTQETSPILSGPRPPRVPVVRERLERYEFLERNCCGNEVFDPSVAEPTCEIGGDGGSDVATVIAVSSVAAVAVLALLCFCAWRFKKKKVKEAPVLQLPSTNAGTQVVPPQGARAATFPVAHAGTT